MLRMKTCSSALAILFAASSCAAPMASTMPASRAALPTFSEIEEEGVASVDYHGIPMIAFTDPAFKLLLIRHKGEKRDLEMALANETFERELAQAQAKRLTETAKTLDWRATWGPPLAFGGGITVAGLVALIIMSVMRTVGGN